MDIPEVIENSGLVRSFFECGDRNAYEDSENGCYIQLCILLSNQMSMALLMSRNTAIRSFREMVGSFSSFPFLS